MPCQLRPDCPRSWTGSPRSRSRRCPLRSASTAPWLRASPDHAAGQCAAESENDLGGQVDHGRQGRPDVGQRPVIVALEHASPSRPGPASSKDTATAAARSEVCVRVMSSPPSASGERGCSTREDEHKHHRGMASAHSNVIHRNGEGGCLRLRRESRPGDSLTSTTPVVGRSQRALPAEARISPAATTEQEHHQNNDQ
jgi:hypothetical protein